MPFLDKLNEQQLEAVKHVNGALLIIAGAGSGKTLALTHRVANLIKSGVNPWNILAVTFTNKAAKEMQERISDLVGSTEQADLPVLGTFHSICVRILRREIHDLGYENSFVIFDSADQLILCRRIMKELGIDEKQHNPKSILHHISSAKNELISAKDYENMSNTYFTDTAAQVYKKYQEELKKNNALDFDDLLMITIELLKTFPDKLEKYQNQFQYICVDEYQDTNHAQYTLVKKLADKHGNICVVGDDWQSIYSWRGANMQNILDFSKDYPDAKVIKLEQNYRSTQNILDAADYIIKKNDSQTDKKLWTEKKGGEKISLVTAQTERHEGEIITQSIENLMRSNELDYKDFSVLYRTNAQSRVLEEVFLKYGIPYKIVGGIRFYERKEIKDILAYLRVVHNSSDSVSLLRIINVPARKIGAKTIEDITNAARQNNMTVYETLRHGEDLLSLSSAKINDLNKFVELIEKLKEYNKTNSVSGLIKHVIEMSGYKTMLMDDGIQGEARLENIQELIGVAAKYDKLNPELSLNIFLEEVALISDLDSIDEQDNAVTLMTAHAAKGLEFPYVFVAGLEEGVFPHSRSLMDRTQLEEERRLMYVAITRAKEKIWLLNAKQRLLYGEYKYNAPSQFLMDIPDELIEGAEKTRPDIQESTLKPIPEEEPAYNDGTRVSHPQFGEGIVLNVTGGIITIAFKNPRYGVKKLALNIAPLSIIQ